MRNNVFNAKRTLEDRIAQLIADDEKIQSYSSSKIENNAHYIQKFDKLNERIDGLSTQVEQSLAHVQELF